MEIYLVRHGETNGNVGKRHQPAHTRLTRRGELQAEEVGEQLAQLQPTHLVCSSQVRAVETASIIGERIGFIPETNELFKELIRPSQIHGRKLKSAGSLWYILMWFLGKRGGDGEKEGESRAEFYGRMQQAKLYLESQPADARVVVVSHSVFINLFVEMVGSGPRLSLYRAIKLFFKIFTMKNTGVIKLTLQNEGGEWVWRVVS